MQTDNGSPVADEIDPVRVVLDHRHAPRERLWGQLVAPSRVRLLNLAHFCDLCFGDVLEVEPVCGCEYDDGVPHYVAVSNRLSRVARRIQAYTHGTSARRMASVADYLATWPTLDDGAYGRPSTGVVVCPHCPCCGELAGLMAEARVDREEGDTHWALAFRLDADEDEVRRFLDGVPYLAFHELMPEDEESQA